MEETRFHVPFKVEKSYNKEMRIRIICVGKLKEGYLKAGIAEYNKRLGQIIEIIEVADEKIPERPSNKEIEAVKNCEGKKILSSLTKDDKVVVLSINGKLLKSEELAIFVKNEEIYGTTRLAFIIGGSLGVSDEILKRADLQLSFGKLTLPHQLMRLVLMEQIYRITMINRGSTYHK